VLPKTADITVKQQENTVEIACSGRKFLDGKDAEEFPIWEAVRPAGTVYTKTEDEGTSPRKKVTYTYEVVKTQTQICCLPPAVLGDMLAQVAYAAAEDDSRPVLQTTFVHLKDDRFIIAAADSFRLAELKTEMPGAGSWEHPVLIHAKYFEQIAKLLPKNAAVTIEVTSTEDKLVKKDEETIPDAQPFTTMVEAQFTAENVVVYLRPTDGIYPNYVGMIPKMADTSVICETAELLSGYKAVWPVAKDASNITRMRVAGNMVYIEAKREEQAESTAHEISATRSGPDIQVILNGQYMLDFLKVTKSPEVIIELTKPGRPVLFRPTGGGVEARYVVMPMSSNR
jgi:DNA polymerase-3 subunit beta